MKKLKLTLAAASAAFALSACTTMATDVFEMAPGVYTISGENYMTYDAGDVRMDLMKKAAEYCAKQGKKLNVLETSGSDAQAYQGFVMGGKTATAQVNFSCVDAK